MARPTSSPTFAAGSPVYTPAGDPWDGDPSRVNPGPAVWADGLTPGTCPAAWINEIAGVAHEWAAWAEEARETSAAYASAKTRTLRLTAWSLVDGGSSGSPMWEINSAGTGAGRIRAAQVNNAVLVCPISGLLPQNGSIVISRIKALVKPISARATGTNRMKVSVIEENLNYTTPSEAFSAELHTATDDGTTALQVIDTGAISRSMSASLDHSIVIRSGNGGSIADLVFGVEVTFSQGAPRAF